ncbi:MAG TPA: DUF429 domain-containing protein [Acidimicrobiales bacterium]|nr:DUF429 domain-containing protein [Acidimicrobiales bacterium]
MRVVGIDGCPGGWFGLVLGEGTTAAAAPTVAELLSAVGPVDVAAIDIPIGLPRGGPRAADVAARARLSARRATVFLTPVREALEAPTLAEAVVVSRARTGVGVSAQAYQLRSRVLEVDAWVRAADVDAREAHPEVSFAEMSGGPLTTSKKTWAGVTERLALLSSHGVEIPSDLGRAGLVAGPDDVVDAAAAAWTARRVATGHATCLPSAPEDLDGWPCAIWA